MTWTAWMNDVHKAGWTKDTIKRKFREAEDEKRIFERIRKHTKCDI